MAKIFTVAHVPDELQQAWLQHMRDFDVAHPGCHFEELIVGDFVFWQDGDTRLKGQVASFVEGWPELVFADGSTAICRPSRVTLRDPKNRRAAISPPIDAGHPDDTAVDLFSDAMKRKLEQKRQEGRGGWEDKAQCSAEFLSQLLREHIEKGDPVDVANLAMMLHQRGERII